MGSPEQCVKPSDNISRQTSFVDESDVPVGLAMAELAAALPFDLGAALPLVRRLFTAETNAEARAALAGALALLGERPPEVMSLLLTAQQDSIYQGVRLGKGLIMRPAAGEKSRYQMENIVGLPVHDQVLAWVTESGTGVEDQRFFAAAISVRALFLGCMDVIWFAP